MSESAEEKLEEILRQSDPHAQVLEILPPQNENCISVRAVYLNEHVAVSLHPSMSANSLAEFQMLARGISRVPPHPGVSGLLDFLIDSGGSSGFNSRHVSPSVHNAGLLTIVPYCAHGTLHQLLHYTTSFGRAEQFPLLLRMLIGAADGLAHLHKHGVVHREVCSKQVLLTDDWNGQMAFYGSISAPLIVPLSASSSSSSFPPPSDYPLSRSASSSAISALSPRSPTSHALSPSVSSTDLLSSDGPSSSRFNRQRRNSISDANLVSYKTDVWFFGALIFETCMRHSLPDDLKLLLQSSAPVSSLRASWANEIMSLIDVLRSGTDTPGIMREDIRQLILDCCDSNAGRRPSMSNVASRLRHALALLLEEDSLEVALRLKAWAELHYQCAQYNEAEPLFERVWRIRSRFLSPHDPALAFCANALAANYVAQHKYALAEPLLRQALAIYEETKGQSKVNVAGVLVNLADALQEQGRESEAEPLYIRALGIYEQLIVSPDAPSRYLLNMATALNNLALLYRNQQLYDAAEPLYVHSLVIYEKVCHENHVSVATALQNLAEVRRAQGKLSEAEPLYRRSLAIYMNALGPNHAHVQQIQNRLASLVRSPRATPASDSSMSNNAASFLDTLTPSEVSAWIAANSHENTPLAGTPSRNSLRKAVSLFNNAVGSNCSSNSSTIDTDSVRELSVSLSSGRQSPSYSSHLGAPVPPVQLPQPQQQQLDSGSAASPSSSSALPAVGVRKVGASADSSGAQACIIL